MLCTTTSVSHYKIFYYFVLKIQLIRTFISTTSYPKYRFL